MSVSFSTASFDEAFINELTRLYHESRENEMRLIRELDLAREVQQMLLPGRFCKVPGFDLAGACVPMCELGGDFYDFLPYESGRLAIALGDVSGKGAAAALLGALTLGILRAHNGGDAWQPVEMLALLNDRIHDVHLKGRFVAMLLAVLDAKTRRLTIANAGNPYPLILRNGRVQQVRIAGIPIALMSGTRYEGVSLDVRLGDIIVLASDGIFESLGNKQHTVGAEILATTLNSLPSNATAEEIISTILYLTDASSRRDGPSHDDRALVVIRATESPVNFPCRSGRAVFAPDVVRSVAACWK